jgi:outer membrane protein
MRIWNRFALLAATVAMAAALGNPALAAARNVDPNEPSFVDLNQALAAYRKTTAFAKYAQKLTDQRKTFSDEMTALAQARYATDAERQEMLAIKANPKPTDRQTERLNELVKQSDAVDNELATLSQKANPTDAELKRITELSTRRTEAARNLAKEENDRRDKLRTLEADLMTNVENDLLKIVEKVAKDNKLTTIYERRAVLFGGNDLTDEVVKKLPK